MALEHQIDPQEWSQDEQVSAMFGSDVLAWTECVPNKAVTWRAPKRKVFDHVRDAGIIFAGYDFMKGHVQHFVPNCSRGLAAYYVPPEYRTSPPVNSLRTKFEGLVAWWRHDTQFSSSLDEKILHPAYQTIMTMGAAAVPLVLEELQTSRGHWFWALHFMTGDDPVPEGANVNAAREAWLTWGRLKGFLR